MLTFILSLIYSEDRIYSWDKTQEIPSGKVTL
jgi:hypothetical protein